MAELLVAAGGVAVAGALLKPVVRCLKNVCWDKVKEEVKEEVKEAAKDAAKHAAKEAVIGIVKERSKEYANAKTFEVDSSEHWDQVYSKMCDKADKILDKLDVLIKKDYKAALTLFNSAMTRYLGRYEYFYEAYFLAIKAKDAVQDPTAKVQMYSVILTSGFYWQCVGKEDCTKSDITDFFEMVLDWMIEDVQLIRYIKHFEKQESVFRTLFTETSLSQKEKEFWRELVAFSEKLREVSAILPKSDKLHWLFRIDWETKVFPTVLISLKHSSDRWHYRDRHETRWSSAFSEWSKHYYIQLRYVRDELAHEATEISLPLELPSKPCEKCERFGRLCKIIDSVV